uniref:Uncharacterized protein n=1 Tax=Glossina pallidipes TaxID=7398 RepID=A0A1A9ZZG8_GLOPL
METEFMAWMNNDITLFMRSTKQRLFSTLASAVAHTANIVDVPRKTNYTIAQCDMTILCGVKDVDERFLIIKVSGSFMLNKTLGQLLKVKWTRNTRVRCSFACIEMRLTKKPEQNSALLD